MPLLGSSRINYPGVPYKLNGQHPAARNLRLCAVSNPDGSMYDLFTQKVGVWTLASGEINTLGPCAFPSSTTSGGMTWPAIITSESVTAGTIAFIGGTRSIGHGQAYIAPSAGNGNLTVTGSGQIAFIISGFQFFTGQWPFALPNQNYFVVASWRQGSTTANPGMTGVVANLSTGQLWTATSNFNRSITIGTVYNTITYTGGLVDNGRLAMGMFSATSLSLEQQLAWARDPWGLTHPRGTNKTRFLGVRGPLFAGANNLALSTNDATDSAAFAASVASSVPRLSYFVSATVLNRLKVALGDNTITPAPGNSVDGQGTAGQLVIGTSGLTPNSSTGVLATIALQFPSFSYSGRTATMLGVPLSVTPSANGTAALAEVRDNSGNTIISGLTVGATGSGANVQISTTGILTSQSLTCTSASIAG